MSTFGEWAAAGLERARLTRAAFDLSMNVQELPDPQHSTVSIVEEACDTVLISLENGISEDVLDSVDSGPEQDPKSSPALDKLSKAHALDKLRRNPKNSNTDFCEEDTTVGSHLSRYIDVGYYLDDTNNMKATWEVFDFKVAGVFSHAISQADYEADFQEYWDAEVPTGSVQVLDEINSLCGTILSSARLRKRLQVTFESRGLWRPEKKEETHVSAKLNSKQSSLQQLLNIPQFKFSKASKRRLLANLARALLLFIRTSWWTGHSVVDRLFIEHDPTSMEYPRRQAPYIHRPFGCNTVADETNKIISHYASEFLKLHQRFLATHIRRYDAQPRVKVAVLDTGLDQNNSELRGLLAKERIIEHRSAIAEIVSFDGATAEDTDSHGTHTASLLHKIAPHVDLYIAKIASTAHKGVEGLENVVEAIKWAIEKQVDIISMSFGFPDKNTDLDTLSSVIEAAHKADIILFAAASNTGDKPSDSHSQIMKTYIRMPNSSTAPPPGGPIHLGHVLDSLAIIRPLNRKSRLDIPPEDILPPQVQQGFEATRKKLMGGTYGIGAKLLSILGAGLDANGLHGDHWQETVRTECLRTISFIPTDEYIQQTLSLASVRSFLESSTFKPTLYMVTGLKIAEGASVQIDVGRSRGFALDLALNLPVTPVEAGPKLEFAKSREESESFRSSSFVLALQVEKIKVKRQGFSHKPHLKGGMYRFSKRVTKQEAELELLRGQKLMEEDIEMMNLDSPGEDFAIEEGTDMDGPEETFWVIPQKAFDVTED
ncbi:hypothetical protein VMCG_01924 [Cytospora schulzeri]|uniref:Uncharacterized protein n=1 Tax=Cytospora schulzeri TaxID=448051 RepID=A0A423X350_9PEZI|nr:hypothetical protein VMCG_01924 [Valsa malicola]